ncbi:hypothetical protein SLEP1_g21153 [Rubroshorea leprosula]|uniref:Uncharacterized protein n=1 Tax=Rubroshorea leprosula TaxID=152421 RepID=A0AAV5J4Y5_9ROSI|nr:hypothetical protein SLEP1_g21153 [Rubroshorea leprosula]
MKAYSITMAVLVVLLSILMSTWLNRAQVEGRAVAQVQSLSTSSTGSSSQSLGDFPGEKKNAYKQVDSSFQRIPPSTSNPIQNK